MTLVFRSHEETYLEFCKRWYEQARPYFKWQIMQFLPYLGKRVGDIGCGLGNFAPFLSDRELYVGFEPEQDLREEFLRRHQVPNVKLAVEGDVTAPGVVSEMQAHRLDSVICINVLEHLKDDRRAFSHMVKGIVSSGMLGLLVPALPSLFGTLDELDGHFRRYTKKDLIRLAQAEDVDIFRLYYMNLVGAFGWFLKGRVLKVRRHENQDYRLMNWFLPAVSFLEGLVPPPLGLSLVMVVKKR